MSKNVVSALVACVLVLGLSPSSRADEVADFYRNKTLTIAVAGGAGSTMALYCRLMAAHWSRHIPGKPNVVCQFRPGAGGTTAAAYMYAAAPKDGTVVGEVLSASVLAPALRKVKFDAREFQWLGSVAPKPAVIAVWHTSRVKTLDDAKNVETMMGSTGKGSETYLLPTLMNALLGTKFKVIMGYSDGTADINLAMQKNEVDGRWGSWAAWATVNPDWVRDKKIIPLVQYGPRIPELPQVPHLKDLVTDPIDKQIIQFIELSQYVGMGYYLPPGAPRSKVEALRRSFDALMKDPEFLAAGKKRQADIAPLGGEALQELTKKAFAVPENVLDKLRKAVGFVKP